MATNIITSENLERFKWEFLELIKEHIDLLLGKVSTAIEDTQWLKSHQVQRMLSISPDTLQTLHINGTIHEGIILEIALPWLLECIFE